MNEKPLISICIPTYNRADCLRDCLNSIVCQFDDEKVYKQMEVIISDNASTDNTMCVVKEFQKKFFNIHYHRNDTNIGFDKNLLRVVEKSTGTYCMTIGDDDAYFADCFAKIIEKIRLTEASYYMLNSWGYDRRLQNQVLSHPNFSIAEDQVFDNLAQFVRSIKKYRDLVGYFGGMSNQLFLRDKWMAYDKKNDFVGTQCVHMYVLLSVCKSCKFIILSEPCVKTRGENMRWNSFGQLGTTMSRVNSTIGAVIWISKKFELPISAMRITLYFYFREFWISFKNAVKIVLSKLGLRN